MYESTILAFGAMALLMLVQLLVADMVGIKTKHIPGGAVPVDHDQFLFRSTRTVANTNESVAIFVLACLFCIFAEASPDYTAYAAWAFVAARLFYAAFYYSNIKLWRSVSFGVSLLSLLALLLVGFLT